MWTSKNGRRLSEEYHESQQEAEIETLLRISGMTEFDAQKNFGSFEVTPQNRDAHFLVTNYLRGWPESGKGGRGFIIRGKLGVGKTHLCLAFLREMIYQHRVVCQYANIKITLDEAKASFDTDSVDPFHKLKRRELLFLDDLGSERATDYSLDRISDIVTYRYVNYLPTIYTCNALSWKELDRNLTASESISAQRVVQRIMERTEAVVIQGTSRRRPLKNIL